MKTWGGGLTETTKENIKNKLGKKSGIYEKENNKKKKDGSTNKWPVY